MKHFISLVVVLVVVSSVACGGSSSSSPDAAGGPSACSAARAQLLGAVNSVSTGSVTVLSSSSGVTTLYVDASAGGLAAESANPWIFVSLGGKAKASVTDTTSVASTGWDLALKRPALYTNDGDGGDGQGGAVMIQKPFASVTAADASSAAFATEKFFDAQCNPMTDPIGAPLTTFSAWYDYDQTAHTLTPAAGTWLVRGSTGTLYKLRIDSYYSAPDGSDGTGDGGTFKLDVGAL
ncbi:MAG TPA: HmuY family protein [Kofleriaceae bacterium]|nr:HmuY family protein [Kofleriaceae bacterium]